MMKKYDRMDVEATNEVEDDKGHFICVKSDTSSPVDNGGSD
jgi:hypothetical protein